MIAFWVDDLAVLYWPWVPGDEDTPGLAEDGDSGDDDGMAAVVVVVAFIAFWWIATHGKGGVPGRIIAWGTLIVVAWVLVAVTNPLAAGEVASAAASGTSAAITGLGRFIADVLGGQVARPVA